MRREDLLKQAESLVNGHREEDYGPANINHQRIADMWSVILNYEVSLQDVYLCMIAVKMSRLIHDSEHEDSWIDIAGYAALGGEVAIPPLEADCNQEDVKYTVTEYCSLFYVLAFGADGHGHIEFESEHEEDCAEYIREQKTQYNGGLNEPTVSL